jgi:signal transduction histidine kinase
MLALAAADSAATELAAASTDARCDATAVLADRLAAWHDAAQSAAVRLTAPPAPGELPVRCAESELAQIVDVVLDNGIKYAGASATVRWTGRVEHGLVRLEIADDGPGVAEEHLPKLTDRFWRAGQGPGTGLGLAIAERLVTARGGHLSIHTGQPGLVVRIVLPGAPR